MIEILIDFLIKLLERSIPFALRRKFPPKRITSQIKIRVAAKGEGIVFMNGELPKANVVIQITNLSPFPLELERAFGAFSYGNPIGDFTYLHREKIPAASEMEIPLQTDLTKEQADYIQKMIGHNPRVSVMFNAHILCKVHDLDLTRTLETTHFRLYNFTAAE